MAQGVTSPLQRGLQLATCEMLDAAGVREGCAFTAIGTLPLSGLKMQNGFFAYWTYPSEQGLLDYIAKPIGA